MSENIQPLNTIGPMGQQEQSGSSGNDPVQAEYEDGKKALGEGNYGQAAVSLHNSLVGFEQRGDEAGVANASNQLGHLCMARKEFDKSYEHYARALEIVEKNNDRMSILAVLAQIAELYSATGENQKGIEVCLEMLDHYQDNRDPGGTVMVLEKMAGFYKADNQLDKAVDSYRTISSIHKNFNHLKMAAKYAAMADEIEVQ